MIHKDWKKRLKSLKKAKELHLIIGGMITLPALIVWSLTGNFVDTFIVSGVIFGLSGLLTYIAEVFFAKNSSLDDTIVQTLQNKQKIKNENQLKQYPKQIWDKKKQQMWDAVSQNNTFNREIHTLISAITYMLEHCSLSEKDTHYFIHEFSDEFSTILTDYQKLRGEHQKRMEKRVKEFVDSKITEWEKVHIHPVQDVLEQNFIQKLEKSSQTEEEKIYITE